ncbi:MAG: GPR endopeptidase [Clostridia bacterium]|nr:GPR endopeptidase [Clostridia bacterium]
MQVRTDLAMEAAARAAVHKQQAEGMELCTLDLTEREAARIGKSAGRYITATVPPLTDDERDLEKKAIVLGEELRRLLPEGGSVLVVGLGNEAITPDALGPRTASMVLATRHIQGEFARSVGLDDLRPTVVLKPNVLGNTGLESSEMVRGVCGVVKPSAVIAVDALAARSVARLGCTVQFSDTGISPGSGVGNNRKALNRETLGLPVIGVGVPTVVDAGTLARDLTGAEQGAVSPRGAEMMVTPREIDLVIARAARLLAMTIHAALQPNYSPLELLSIAL